jgi:hypothetical protein
MPSFLPSEESALEQATAAAAVAKAQRVDHSMRAMDAMLSYGDHQQVVGGIFENVHSMEVSAAGCILTPRFCSYAVVKGCGLILGILFHFVPFRVL